MLHPAMTPKQSNNVWKVFSKKAPNDSDIVCSGDFAYQ